ncbi:MAG: hypothetical protein ACFCD0_08465 [Gemmataceae bacterium]
MATRRSVCPACGKSVRVPMATPRLKINASKTPPRINQDQQNAYMLVPTWQEGNARPGEKPSYAVMSQDEIAAHKLQAGTRRKRRKTQRVRNDAFESGFFFAIHALRTIFVFSVGLTLASWLVLSVAVRPGFGSKLLEWVLVLQVTIGIVSYVFASWCSVLTSIVVGEDVVLSPFGCVSDHILKSWCRCLVCFLAGPGPLLAIALWYWYTGGDFHLVDWIILAEIVVAAITFWFLAIVAVTADNSMASVTPSSIGRLLGRLGPWTSGFLVGFVVLGVIIQSMWGRYVLGQIFESLWGWFLLGCWFAVAQLWIVAAFRWIGGACFRLPRKQ